MSRREEEQKRVPSFKDETEAAAFWDTHSPLDYPEEFREAQVEFSRPLITLRSSLSAHPPPASDL